MEEEHIFTLMRRFLKERQDDLTDYIMSGRPEDLKAYVGAVSKHQAYADVENEIKELEKRFLDH
jgi:predicted GIY-YIG superfamily endonuclease